MSKNDPKTCASESVTFEVQPRNPDHFGYRVGDLALATFCEDCGEHVVVDVEEFSEQWIAEVWNAHHARQIAHRIAQIGGESA